MLNEDGVEIVDGVQYVNKGHICEAGLFDASFACVETETERRTVGTTIVWLCSEHFGVINIKPTATEES